MSRKVVDVTTLTDTFRRYWVVVSCCRCGRTMQIESTSPHVDEKIAAAGWASTWSYHRARDIDLCPDCKGPNP